MLQRSRFTHVIGTVRLESSPPAAPLAACAPAASRAAPPASRAAPAAGAAASAARSAAATAGAGA